MLHVILSERRDGRCFDQQRKAHCPKYENEGRESLMIAGSHTVPLSG
jgi:hypothetical protein